MSDQMSPKRILIVEDDNLQQVILERMIVKLGHTVMGKVADGASAIQSALRLDSIDVVLMDIRLEDDIDGIEAVARIKESASDIKVIYVTANTEKANLERAKKTGFIDFIRKPVRLERLNQALNKAFGVN